MKQISKKLTCAFIEAKRAYDACKFSDPEKSKLLDDSTNAWLELTSTCNIGFWEATLIESLACMNEHKETLETIGKALAMLGIELVDE